MFERIKKWYWTEEIVINAVVKDIITEEQCNEILGQE